MYQYVPVCFEKYVHVPGRFLLLQYLSKYLVSKVHSCGLCVYFFIDLKQVNQWCLNKKDRDSDLPIYLPRGWCLSKFWNLLG